MKVAIFSDLHYPSIRNSASDIYLSEPIFQAREAFFKAFLDRFFQQKADLYVSLGDITNHGKSDEFDEIFNLFKQYDKNFNWVFGSHDLYGGTRTELINQHKLSKQPYIETEEALFVFLETARELDFKRWNDTLSSEQLDELGEKIRQSGDKPMVIFAHHPVHDTTHRSNIDNGPVIPETKLWEVLQQKKGKGIYINGHLHMDSIVQREQWTFVQICAVYDDPNARLLEITNEKIALTYADISTEEMHKQAELVGEAINHFRLIEFAKGTTHLQNVTVNL